MIREKPAKIDGVRELVPLFDAFLIDQFGVLHDGTRPYSGAVEALAALRQAGRPVVLLSNSGRRAAPNAERMLKLGFRPGSWDHFVTSGEVAWRRLSASLRERAAGEPPLRCLFLARGGDSSAIEGLPLRPVERGSEADLVLLSGSEADRFDLDHYRRLLEPAAARNVECICTNPDKIMLTPDGPRPGAGAIADLYAGMGGPVTRIGKPFPEIYQAALTLLERGRYSHIACIGDSVEHDIAGGVGAGLSTVLVATGVLASSSASDKAALFSRHKATPDYVLAGFTW